VEANQAPIRETKGGQERGVTTKEGKDTGKHNLQKKKQETSTDNGSLAAPFGFAPLEVMPEPFYILSSYVTMHLTTVHVRFCQS
jgi:hypothetical protein